MRWAAGLRNELVLWRCHCLQMTSLVAYWNKLMQDRIWDVWNLAIWPLKVRNGLPNTMIANGIATVTTSPHCFRLEWFTCFNASDCSPFHKWKLHCLWTHNINIFVFTRFRKKRCFRKWCWVNVRHVSVFVPCRFFFDYLRWFTCFLIVFVCFFYFAQWGPNYSNVLTTSICLYKASPGESWPRRSLIFSSRIFSILFFLCFFLQTLPSLKRKKKGTLWIYLRNQHVCSERERENVMSNETVAWIRQEKWCVHVTVSKPRAVVRRVVELYIFLFF